MGRMSEMSIDIRTARMREQSETFGMGYGDDKPEPASVKRCAWCCSVLMGHEQRGRICTQCLRDYDYDQDDCDGVQLAAWIEDEPAPRDSHESMRHPGDRNTWN